MKRIALIRNSYSYDIGGAEIFPVTLAKILAENHYDPYVLSSNMGVLDMANDVKIKAAHSPWWSFQNFSGIRLVAFPLYLLWILFVAAWYFVYFLKNHIDIVHPQSRDDYIAATFAAKLLRRRVAWSDHADLKYVYMNHKTWYKNPVGKLVFFMSRYADHVHIESNNEKRLIQDALGKKLPSNYGVMYIGVVDSFKPSVRKSDKLVLVSTSRLVTTKGIGELIEAVKLVHNKDVVLKICGDGPESNKFKSMASGIKNIEFLGHIKDVDSILKTADVFIHPSYNESFGLSLVEAEMYKLPIVACRVGSIPEIVKDGVSGILVAPKDADGLANAITTLLNDKRLRESMGEAGRQIFLKNFQFDQIVRDKIIPLYNEGV